MSKEKWAKIADSNIKHIWLKAKNDTCDNTEISVEVSPDFYQENGVPICKCGEDFEYSHTEIKIS